MYTFYFLIRANSTYFILSKVGYFCQSWGFFILLTWFPTYYLERFGVDVKYLGYFAGKCYLI